MSENPYKRGTPLWSMAELNRRFGGLGRQVTDPARPMRQLQQWLNSQLQVHSVEGYPTASPAESLAPIVEAVSRRTRKKSPGDDFRLYVMALRIDAGLANSPTEAAARLQEAGGWSDNELITAKDRLVGKYNAREFQDDLATIRKSPDYQHLVNLIRGNRPE